MKKYLEQSIQFSEFVKSIFFKLPIESINHVRVYKSGKAFILMNDPAWCNTFFQREMESEILTYDCLDTEEKCFKWTEKKIFTHGIPKHVAVADKYVDLNSLLTIQNKTEIYSDRFVFARKSEGASSYESLYNSYDKILDRLSKYYANATELVSEAEENMFLLNNSAPLVKTNTKLLPADSINAYLSEKLKMKININAQSYTFLLYMLCGWTAKQIAEVNHLSFRTVESYLQILRDTLDCKSNGAVFYLLQKTNVYSIYFEPFIKTVLPPLQD